MRHLPLFVFVFTSVLVVGPGRLEAQPLRFGHAADPLEAPTRTGFAQLDRNEVIVRAGPSYIGDRWRAFGTLEARLELGQIGLGLNVPGRTGVRSAYEEDYDEAYDLLRRLAYLRLSPTSATPLYARIGPVERMQVGLGLLVDGFATNTAWEERTIGVEAAARLGGITVTGFAEDVVLDGLVGGSIAVVPLRGSTSRLRRTQLTVEGVYDLALDTARGDSLDRPFALGMAIEAPLWGEAFAVGPYLAGAYQQGFDGARGLSAETGVAIRADRFADLADLRLLLGVYGFGDGVRVAQFDAFYPLTRGGRIIARAGPYFEEPGAPRLPATLSPDAIEAGWGLRLDFTLRLGESFSLASTARLPVDGQPVGTHRLHAAYASSRGLRFRFAFERSGLDRFGEFFKGFDADLTALIFDVDYPLTRGLVASMRSRYGFVQLPPLTPDAPSTYLVDRRFEPTIGLRLRF